MLTASTFKASRTLATVFKTKSPASRVLTNRAPHACIARSRMGGFPSGESQNEGWTIDRCDEKAVKNKYTAVDASWSTS